MEDRWIHQEAGTGGQRSGSGPGNALNPKGAYRADTEGPFQSLSAMAGGCIGTIKALFGLRVKQFGRVLVPFAAGCAAPHWKWPGLWLLSAGPNA